MNTCSITVIIAIFNFNQFDIYIRYASLYFCCAIEQNDNELLTLEIIHRYVELLDKYFGSVSTKHLFESSIRRMTILQSLNCVGM